MKDFESRDQFKQDFCVNLASVYVCIQLHEIVMFSM